MRHLISLLAALALTTVQAPALGAEPAYHAPRNAFGQPELEGLWAYATYTRLERPPYIPRVALTAEEAAKGEAQLRKGATLAEGVDVGQLDSERGSFDTGDSYMRVRGEIRGAMIVDPADGRLPFRPEVVTRLKLDAPPNPIGPTDNPEDRTPTERCVGGEGANPPILPSPDGNYLQVIQTRDHIALYSEKYHDVRVVRLGDRRHADARITSWPGDEVGWFEGDTLVIESTNFSPSSLVRYQRLRLSPGAKVVERFTRTSADALMYEFTVEDPALYTRTWRAELPFRSSPARIFESACHEGNYALPGILAGAREEERHPAATGGH